MTFCLNAQLWLRGNLLQKYFQLNKISFSSLLHYCIIAFLQAELNIYNGSIDKTTA